VQVDRQSSPPQPGSELAPAQALFWTIAQRYRTGAAHSAFALDIEGPLDGDALCRALDAIVAHHVTLRTAFTSRGGNVQGRPVEGVWPEIQRIDVDRTALARLLIEEPQRPFDLAKPPLVRFTVARLDDAHHVLVAVFHHIATDGTSMWRLFPAELAELYRSARAGAPLVLPPTPQRYADFAIRSRAENEGPGAQAMIDFWRTELADRPPILELPTDRVRPHRPAGVGAHAERVLSKSVRDRVHQIAPELGVRPVDVLLAAWAVLLHRASGMTDILIGTPHANRTPETGGVHGCFADTTVVRVDLAGLPSFAEVARRSSDRRRRARPHRALSASKMLETLVDASDSPSRPIYQVMFNYLDFSLRDARLDGLVVHGRRLDCGSAMLDLALDVFDETDGLRVVLEHDTEIFDTSTADRLLGRYETLLSAALLDPKTAVADLPLLDREEARALFTDFQGASMAAATDRLLADVLWQSAEAHLEQTALQVGGRTLTYRALFSRASRLAAMLRARGVKAGDVVAVEAADKLVAITSVLGVLGAGAAYLPIDRDLPDARAADLMRAAGSRLVLSEPSQRRKERASGVEVLAVDVVAEDAPLLRESSGATPDDPAYVLYTSGSTGTPKGVVIRNRNVVHQLESRCASYPSSPARFLFSYSLAFDASVAGLFWTLATGGLLIAVDERERKEPGALVAAIRAHEPTHLDFVPTLYDAVLAAATLSDMQSVTTVTLGGEALDRALVDRHFARVPSARLFNEYGPTETTVFSTIHEVKAGDQRVPIGRLAPGTRGYVLDSSRKPVPIGQTGELYLGGGGVARGYIGRPDLDAEAFVDDPFVPGEKLYKTGDRVRWFSDGTLDFVGRVDRQVKLRGFRIELGEIEAQMGLHPSVERSAVKLMRAASGADILVGYWSGAATADELRAELRKKLPAHMVPSAWVKLDTMPMGRTGKIDVSRLPAPALDARGARRPPSTDIEKKLALIWGDVLGSKAPALDDDFFEHGGHSLLAVKLLSQIEKRFGHAVPMVTLFERATLGALAEALSRGPGASVELRALESIRREGYAAPLYFVGSTSQARALAPFIDESRPIYGLNIFGLYDGGETRQISLVEIARTYVEEIRRVQPEGPYFLTGYCAEAALALEMAVQLRAQGQTIAFLGFIDGLPFVTLQESKTARLVRNLSSDGVDYVAQLVRRRARVVSERAKALRTRLERKVGGDRASLAARHFGWVEIYNRAMDSHPPRAYDGRISLFLTTEIGEVDLRELGSIASGGVDVERVRAYHDNLFLRPQVEALAKVIDDAMAKAENGR